MHNNKRLCLPLFFLLISTLTFSQEQALKSIVQDDLKQHLTFISSDELQGRKLGVGDGLEKAAEYIERNAKENGLQPLNDSYTQTVDIFSIHPDNSHTYLKAEHPKKKKSLKSPAICLDKQLLNLDFKGKVVFAGFGKEDESAGYDDYEGLDVKGKVVLLSSGDMESFQEDKNFQWSDRCEHKKRRLAFEKGAEAVVLITNPNDKKDKIFAQLEKWMNRNNFTLKTENQNEGEKYFITTPEFADFLLGGKNSYKKYLETIVKENKANLLEPENDEIEIHIQREIQTFHSRNILGMVEGSDPFLKDEFVVYMAHYDHLGVSEDGDVYNGADDNGSGTTVLLELAEAFSSTKVKPKRSLLFLWVTSEEIGLFGSGFYSGNPLVPMEKTTACINLDMVGRVYEPRDSVWRRSPKMVKDFDGLFTLTNDVWPELKQISDSVCYSLHLVPDNSLPAQFLRSSDHYHFHKNDVPILNVATGYHADYHKPTDEVSKINFDKMKRVADFVFLVGYEVANYEPLRKTGSPAN
ncbi:M28 family peptidase [Maribellus comscasis]|uniref:M28 family peptidase n=1 Tax=Maribellus comscasis TaxID=2681766 RepID=A0A6I6JLF9_9BACT|nr:M28 family peptidase [Maribellus comscasis]QGY43646.1 M28 family peptidase [Maribellus comscasis]